MRKGSFEMNTLSKNISCKQTGTTAGRQAGTMGESIALEGNCSFDVKKTSHEHQECVKVLIVGGTGYAGQELARLLCAHPRVSSIAISSTSYAGHEYSKVFPGFGKRLAVTCQSSEDDILMQASECDLVFFALPHGVAVSKINAELLANTRIVDLSGDFRLKTLTPESALAAAKLPNLSVYGLPELNREEIVHAHLIANPGCYATAAILALYPLIKAGLLVENSIIIDGKSGVTGAGRSVSLPLHFNECNESVKTYKAPTHKHTPEIEQALSAFARNQILTTFAAHLVPMNRGILLTAYATLTAAVGDEDVAAIFNKQYGEEPFIRMVPQAAGFPETRWVKGSNFCDIGFAVDHRAGRIVIVSAIDNLMKGAAGQALQNMNIMLGLPETTGLESVPIFPA